ncbi:hypothetical protein E2C01_039293 [Portunus trituberculatus]|uniref:Uncharacterized protein n=1 Tax=Portunus trituberculatus TaxID=210409 RepID=A0A5B7FKE5_PORTR|nr:hypothetical protein [Portunus trituberculatus]
MRCISLWTFRHEDSGTPHQPPGLSRLSATRTRTFRSGGNTDLARRGCTAAGSGRALRLYEKTPAVRFTAAAVLNPPRL